MKKATYEVYALLHVSKECEAKIFNVLRLNCGIREKFIRRGLHLTVYHARRRLPGLVEERRSAHIVADVLETRFMAIAPGGENPRPGIVPGHRPVAIRLTKRNGAIDPIQRLRSEIRRLETKEVRGSRKPSTEWTNCFGARRYQPHITLISSGSNVGDDLTVLGKAFRAELDRIEFDTFQTLCRRSGE